MTCEQCREYQRRIAQLERDLAQTAEAVDVLTHRLLDAKEKGSKK